MDIPTSKKKTPTGTPCGSPTNTIGSMGHIFLTDKIPIKTLNAEGTWVQFKRGDVYQELIDANIQTDNNDGFQTVRKRQSKPQCLYYWHLYAHNLYTFEYGKQNKLSLYFCQPDYQIYQNDKVPQYALDTTKTPNELVPLIFYAKWGNVKFKPISFIAKGEAQIKETLEHISYCVVQTRDDLLYIADDTQREGW